MGGDNAPGVAVQAAMQAVSEKRMDITLVGDREAILHELTRNLDTKHIRVHHCDEVIHMEESPFKAVRRKRDSSIRVAFDLLKQSEVDAVVSAGNSGATLAAGILTLGKSECVERPALACVFPGVKSKVVLIDAGANVDCRPVHLLQFGTMAYAFATSCLDMENPKIGLLNIGQEDRKGNEQVRSAHDLFRASSLNFVGNVEGRDLFSGQVQIVVCDGFVGNVALKLAEGMGASIIELLKEEMMSAFAGEAESLCIRNFLGKFRKNLDYAEYGGAIILGIKGVGIVCHGDSSVTAMKNAINMAASYVEKDMENQLSLHITALQAKGV